MTNQKFIIHIMNNEENKIDQNLNEESLVSDLKKSLDSTIREASITLNELLENIESNVQDNEIRDETKKIIKFPSKGLTEAIRVVDKLLNNKNFITIYHIISLYILTFILKIFKPFSRKND